MAIGRIPEPLAGIQEAILDAKGDLISATAADTPARLAVGSNNQILMADSAQSTGLKWAASATSTLTAKGDLLTATAANTIARLGVGADGTTLVADSSQSTGLKWATAAAGGKLLQVVSSTTTTAITISTTTLTDTGITATITPTASTSKILVLLTYCIDFAVANVRDMESKGRLLRGATTIADYNNNLFAMQITNASTTTGYFIQEGQNSISYLDNPATTLATTYKFQAAPENTVGGRSIRFQTDSGPSTITLFEIGA